MTEDQNEECTRPKMRRDCRDGLRSCPWVSCRYHLIWEAAQRQWSDEEIVDHLMSMRDTCTLDVADEGGVTLERIADIFGVTRERVRQIEGARQTKNTGGVKGIQRIFRQTRARAVLETFL